MSLHHCGHDCAYGARCSGWVVLVYDSIMEDWDRTGGMTEQEARDVYGGACFLREAADLKDPQGRLVETYRPPVIVKCDA